MAEPSIEQGQTEKIDKELTEAKDYLDSQHRKVEAAEAWHDDLCDKKKFYENEVLTLQEEVGSSELVSKVHYYESLIRKLQEKFQNGVPDSSGDLKDVYNLVYKGQHEPGGGEPRDADVAEDDLVDRAGFGFLGKGGSFGPSSTSKVSPSPYARGPPGPVGAGKGPVKLGDPATGADGGEH